MVLSLQTNKRIEYAESLGMNTFKLISSRDLSWMNYNICIIWWGVIASSYNKSLGVVWLKLISLRDLCVFMCMCLCVCVYVCVYGIGCFFFWHINLSQYRVTNWPKRSILNADTRASLVLGTPGLCFCDRNLSDYLSLKLMSSRDFRESIRWC